MNRHLLPVIAMSLAALPVVAAAPQPQNPAAEVPEGITVAPAQGFVDISNTAYPKGISSIGFTFTQEVAINKDNTVPAKLYYNDFETPAEESLVATIDMMSWRTSGVLFKERTWTLPGCYKVEIPKGMFVYADKVGDDGYPTGTEPTPAMTLYYEIYLGYTVTPGSGVVESIDGVDIVFADADEVTATPLADGILFYMDNSDNNYGCTYTIADADADGRANEVSFSFSFDGENEITAPGIYGFNVPAGAFKFKVYGPNHDSDPEDYVEYTNYEVLVKYTIPRAPRPEIDPDPNFAVKSFDEFLLYIPDSLKLWFVDTMAHSPLYKVDAAGNIDESVVYAYAKAEMYNEGDSFVTLKLYNPVTHELLTEYTPEEGGLYCLRLASSLLFGEWAPAVAGEEAYLGGSDIYDYFYTVEGENVGVACPGIDAEQVGPRGVYNLQGVKVADDASSLGNMPKGLYISAGRKIIVK